MSDDLREQIIHGLRSQGWSRIEAENEADERLHNRPRPKRPSEYRKER